MNSNSSHIVRLAGVVGSGKSELIDMLAVACKEKSVPGVTFVFEQLPSFTNIMKGKDSMNVKQTRVEYAMRSRDRMILNHFQLQNYLHPAGKVVPP